MSLYIVIKTKSRFKQYLLLFVSILSGFLPILSGMNAPIQENNITVDPVYHTKNMHQVVSNEYRNQMSLFNGVVAYETGLIRKLYDFGNISPIWGKDKLNRKTITGYNPTGDAIIKLIHAFFYRIPESTSLSDFKETIKINRQKTDLEILEKMADILIACTHARKALGRIYQEIPTFATLNKQNQFLMLQDKNKRESTIKNTININEIDTTSFRSIQKQKRNNIKEALNELIKNVTLSINNIETILDPASKKSIIPVNHKNQKYKIFLQSLLESDPHNNTRLYPSYMTERVLLSFVYKKYGSNKKMLITFYEMLNKKLNNKFLIDTFTCSGYEKIDPEQAQNKLNEFLKSENIQTLESHIEDLLFYFTQIKEIPQENNYKLVTNYVVGTSTDSSTDCMENTIRNFIRLLAYDPTTQMLSLDTLRKKIKSKTDYNQKFINFLNTYNDPKYDDSDDAHREWIQLISNIPYAFYNRTRSNDYKLDLSSGNIKGKTFICLPYHSTHDNSATFLKHGILKSLGNAYVLEPNIHTLIIVLNHLLGLGLFDQKNMDAEIVRPDFIRNYLPLLCQKLGCLNYNISNEFYGKNFYQINDMNIDFTKNLETKLIFDKYTCIFTTKNAHGEMKVHVHGEKNIHIPHILSNTASELLNFIIKTFEYEERITIPHHIPWQSYTFCFLSPLEKIDNTEFLIDALINEDSFDSFSRRDHENEKVFSNHTMHAITKLLMSLFEKYPDEATRIFLKNRLFKYLVSVQYQSTYPIILNDITKSFTTLKVTDSNDAMDIIDSLISKNYQPAFFKIFQLIKNQLNLKTLEDNIDTIKIVDISSLLLSLFDQAININHKTLKESPTQFQSCISEIIDYSKLFVEKSAQSFQKLAPQKKEFSDYNIFSSTLFFMLEKLVKQNEYIEQALEVAEAGLRNDFLKSYAQQLLESIIQTELGFKAIEEIINNLSKINDHSSFYKKLSKIFTKNKRKREKKLFEKSEEFSDSNEKNKKKNKKYLSSDDELNDDNNLINSYDLNNDSDIDDSHDSDI